MTEANKQKPITVEDHPEEEVIVIEGVAYHYNFFRDLGMKGVAIGSVMKIVDRKTVKYGITVLLDKVMTSAELVKDRPRIIMPGSKGGLRGGH